MAETNDFVALGSAGSEHYAGLETFPNPGVSRVEMTSDELTAVCPITGSAGSLSRLDRVRAGTALSRIEVLKIYLSRFRNEGALCEALAVRIRDDIAEALELALDKVHATLKQKARGGITITAAISRLVRVSPWATPSARSTSSVRASASARCGARSG